MFFAKAIFALAVFAPLAASQCASDVTCQYVSAPPTLDGDLGDWSDVPGVDIELQQQQALGGNTYTGGKLQAKCVYDDNQIYFTMDVPGEFSFDANSNELCAAIGIMLKVGPDASYVDMGDCPDARDDAFCSDELIDACSNYRVDIGAHWELKTTEQGVKYGTNTGTGDDGVANKDDEYAVHSGCRRDDDGPNAGNEWSGAWAYADGSYKFELSRTLATASATTDIQLAPGNTYEFGYAFWDPTETEEGWTAPGHYVSGCAEEWMKLTLAEGTQTSAAVGCPTGVIGVVVGALGAGILFL